MHGISIKNNSGHILISSEIESLHLAGAAAYIGTPFSGLTNFPDYGSDDGQTTLSGRHIHRYRVAVMGAPVFFIKPNDASAFHGVLNQWSDGFYAYVDIIQSGASSTPPSIYAFIRPSALPSASAGTGIATFLGGGQRAFDSRLGPLAIVTAMPVTPPAMPCDGGQPYQSGGYSAGDQGLDWNFRCDNSYATHPNQLVSPSSGYMFSTPSIAQAVYIRRKDGFSIDRNWYGSAFRQWSSAIWWAMYHSAYRLGNGRVESGWCVYDAGYKYYYSSSSSSWYSGTDNYSYQSGSQPYSDKTINLSENIIIVADSRNYT